MNVNDSRMYFNRELSWLGFNKRVLDESKNTKIPLLERIKFIAIYGTNLDEFYMIRVAGLKRLYANGITQSGPDKLTPLQQLNKIRETLHAEKDQLEKNFLDIKDGLSKEGLFLKEMSELSKEQKAKLHEYFTNNLYPVIVPIMVDSTHPFPHLNNLSFGIAIKLKNKENGAIKYGMVRISRNLPRFVECESGIFVTIENIVGEFAHDLFVDYDVVCYTPFRVTRNADMEIEEEEADDFLQIMSEGLKTRRKGEIVRLEIGNTKDKSLIDFVTTYIKTDPQDLYIYNILLNLSGLWQIAGAKAYAHLTTPPYSPKTLPPLNNNVDILDVLDSQDVLLFHPYESFDPVVNFIQSAAKDPDVLSIRMTLYRVGKNSPIVKALIQAAENSKQVTALVELKARFDEENNLYWAKSLESAGAHVIYGIPGLKVHAKIALVIKKSGNALKEYIHLSTGNYNPSTAKIYTDISLLTSKKEFTLDGVKLFHSLSTGNAHKTKLESLNIAPTQIKPKIIELIQNEAKFGAEGRIILKSNAFVDEDVIRELYQASIAGVKIDLIVRGICCLRPGVKGVSENIRVISIVGKYLEHARIYYFKNDKTQMYFASADIMPRNLIRRVEILTPSISESITKKLLEILNFQLSDNAQAHELKSDGSYVKIKTEGKEINSQEMYEKYINKRFSAALKEDDTKAKKLVNRMLGES